MRMLNGQRLLLLSVACTVLALISPDAGTAPGQEKKAERTEKVTLQYRCAKDAVAPSRFIAVFDEGTTLPLKMTWDLPKAKDKEKREAQDKQKKAFDDLIKKLEDQEINGVEFECRGEWIKKGFSLRVTTVPQITEKGKKRIKDSEP
jgi:hypothetical protein